MRQTSNRKLAAPPCALWREKLTHWWGLGAEAQASEAETQGEGGLPVWRQPEESGLWPQRVHSEGAWAHQ